MDGRIFIRKVPRSVCRLIHYFRHVSLFSTGETRGLVVESGEGVTHAVPVYEGYAIPHAIFSMDIAGKDITEALAEEVLEHHLVSDNTLPQIFQSMREHVCRVQIGGVVYLSKRHLCGYRLTLC